MRYPYPESEWATLSLDVLQGRATKYFNCERDRKWMNAIGERKHTILHFMAKMGFDYAIQWLLREGEGGGRQEGFIQELTAREKYERTALHIAIREGHSACCKALVDGCRDDDERRKLLNCEETCWTALHYAAWYGREEVITWLLSDDEGGGRRLGFDSLMRRDKIQRIAIHLAAREGHLLTCKALVNGCRHDDERRELLNAIGENNWTALHYASSHGRNEVVQWILSDDEGGGRLGFDGLMARDQYGRTALHCAVEKEHLSCCKALVDGCRDDDERRELLNAIGEYNWTALHYAVHRYYPKIVQWILSDDDGGGRRLGFDSLMAKDRHQRTALHLAAQLSCCKALVDGCRDSRERIALIQAVDEKGNTFLHQASHYRRVDVIKWILQSPDMQCIYNLKDNDGFTAIHRAILHNRPYAMTPLATILSELLFDTEAESQAIIDDQKDRKRIATKIDPNIGCGLDWNPW